MNHYIYRFNDEKTLCGAHADISKDMIVVDKEMITCIDCLRLFDERKAIKMKEAGVKK